MPSGFLNYDGQLKAEYDFDHGFSSTLGPAISMKSRRLRTATGRCTLAQLNAGLQIIPATPGRQFMITDFYLIFNGTFTTATAIQLATTETTPTVINSTAIANAGTGTIHGPGRSGTSTLTAANLGLALAKGYGIQIIKTGSSAAGGTDILYSVTYCIAN